MVSSPQPVILTLTSSPSGLSAASEPVLAPNALVRVRVRVRVRARAERLGPFAREDLVFFVLVPAHLHRGLGLG